MGRWGLFRMGETAQRQKVDVDGVGWGGSVGFYQLLTMEIRYIANCCYFHKHFNSISLELFCNILRYWFYLVLGNSRDQRNTFCSTSCMLLLCIQCEDMLCVRELFFAILVTASWERFIHACWRGEADNSFNYFVRTSPCFAWIEHSMCVEVSI